MTTPNKLEHAKLFHYGLIIVGNDRSSIKSGAHERCCTLIDSGLTLKLANIRLGWKGIPGTNTLAYLAASSAYNWHLALILENFLLCHGC
jgi:hypothetical protein